ncbi:hypothetical protein L3X39_02270 [Sabulilitoribacter multivorans]|uniref:Uncharacterized protein n=1 Tax=Flaviramulus multivorans TaxID=1304750 RepID=A0ABS9IGY5_9FLAO|nr:hypothetical protein [Flaviramulus multivorans]MCF7559447.1 hypothetical protein [Flaviramulus multivorans]
MNKRAIAIFFSILFGALITAPTIVSAIDDSVDISIFYSIAEEENENLKLPFPDNNFNEFVKIFKIESNKHLGYYFKNYPKPHLNLISPPPEFIS